MAPTVTTDTAPSLQTMGGLNKNSRLPSSQDILREVRNFVNGATSITKYSRTELARSAIFLLKTLPAAREAILEYLCTIFDDAVNVYSLNLELEMGSGSGVVPSSASETDDIIQEVQDILSGFVSSNAEGWAPIVSAWSLDLLGQLSSKYSDRRGVPHAGSLNEVLQLWMSCRPTRTLIDLSTQCISTLSGSNSDLCIDALLDTSVQHSPHFDWVVAHIGSCFPTMIITRVLACGLKDFCSHGSTQMGEHESSSGSGGGLLPATDKKVPKVASVVGILGHLAAHHSEDIRRALLSLFEDSFVTTPTVQQLATVPYVLQMSSMSGMLRKVITNDFVKALTPRILNALCIQIPLWHHSTSQNAEDLINLVVHMIIQSEEGSGHIIDFLLNTAAPKSAMVAEYLPQVLVVCGRVLDFLLLQIQYLVNSKSASFSVEIPILSTLHHHVSQLCSHLMEDGGQKAHWVVKLFACLSIYGKGSTTSEIIALILTTAKNPQQLGYLSHLLTLVEPTASHDLLETTLKQLLVEYSGQGQQCPLQLLKNLQLIVKWELEGQFGFGKTWLRFMDALCHSLLLPFSELMVLQREREAAECVMNTLSLLNLPDDLPTTSIASLCRSVVFYFFKHAVTNPSINEKTNQLPVCCHFLSKLCEHSSAQHMILRSLLEGVLDESNMLRFGGKRDVATKESGSSELSTENVTLLSDENQKHAVSITLPQSHSTVFHAGIIGDGLRTLQKHPIQLKEDILANVQMLLEMVKASCVPSRCNAEENVSSGPVPTIQGMTAVALLLVELISSDVMFNGLPWPDEEFAKITIERDLHIRRMFDDHPVLWHLLYLVASFRPALCYCSVLLRALAAVMQAFWAGCQERSTSSCPKQLDTTCHLVEVMAIGQLLPPPLAYMAEIFPQVSPYEVYVLLVDVWKYMKENIPTPAAFSTSDAQGYPWRDFGGEPCSMIYTNRLHSILQSNIGKFGSLFIRFFRAQDG